MKRNKNGLGHTYRVGNSYRTVIRRGDHVVTAMAATMKESRHQAQRKLDSLPNLMAGRSALQVDDRSLGRYLIDWLENEHRDLIAHGTYKRYRSLINIHIRPGIGHIDLQKVTSGHINSLLKSMNEKGQSARSRQQARAVLAISLKQARIKGIIAINPVENVPVPQNKSMQFEPLSINEVTNLLSTFEGTFMEARLHIALLCGLRQGEALALTWSDINFEESTLSVSKQVQTVNGVRSLTELKTNRSKRTIALGASTLEVLRRHKTRIYGSEPQSNLLFPAENGGFMHSTNDFNNWKRSLRVCGIKRRRLHDARHTAATLMYSQNVGIETISRVLGHSNSSITSKLYVHTAIEPMRTAAEAVDVAISNSRT